MNKLKIKIIYDKKAEDIKDLLVDSILNFLKNFESEYSIE